MRSVGRVQKVKRLLVLFIIMIIPFQFYAKNRFFFLSRVGNLIKVDIASGTVFKYPKNKGPRLDQIETQINIEIFENKVLAKIIEPYYKKFLLDHYSKDEALGNYILNDLQKDIEILIKLHNVFLNNNIGFTYEVKIPAYKFEKTILGKKISNNEDADLLKNHYKKKKNNYYLNVNWQEAEKLREIFLVLNKENELYTGLDQHGAPSPHKFPRVFEAKSKSHLDIHIVWGVKFTNDLMFGVSVNITNFVMPSLEFMLKYNFNVPDYPFEPYIGGVLYGGVLDGFPIGLSVIGGCDFFPLYTEDISQNKNLFLEAELRLGAVLYAPIYYDTGLNSEGIWKKLSFLGEGGFYFGTGYVWNN